MKSDERKESPVPSSGLLRAQRLTHARQSSVQRLALIYHRLFAFRFQQPVTEDLWEEVLTLSLQGRGDASSDFLRALGLHLPKSMPCQFRISTCCSHLSCLLPLFPPMSSAASEKAPQLVMCPCRASRTACSPLKVTTACTSPTVASPTPWRFETSVTR